MPNLSLNTVLLASLYAPLEAPTNNTGWNHDDHGTTAAYFISQGSEYYLDRPSASASKTALTAPQVSNVQTFIAALVTQLQQGPESSKKPEIQELVTDLNAWSSKLAAGETVDILMSSTLITHVRGSQGDDKATLKLTYAWVPPLSVAILAAVDLDIDWAGTLQGFETGLKVFHELTVFANVNKVLIESIVVGLGIGELGPALALLAAASTLLDITNAVAKMLVNKPNDGGRVNFAAVLAHAINRISACVEPAPAASTRQESPTLDLQSLGYSWITSVKSSTVEPAVSSEFYNAMVVGTYPDLSYGPGRQWYCDVMINDFDSAVPYAVGLPELSWSRNSVGTLLSSKITVDADETIYALVLMLFNHLGQAIRISTFFQSDASAGSIVPPDPMSYPASYLTLDSTNYNPPLYQLSVVIAGQLKETNTEAPSTMQLEWVIPEVMIAFREHIVLKQHDWATMPQLSIGYRMTWNIGPDSYEQGQHTAIGVDTANEVLLVRNDGGNDIYWDVGAYANNSINWTPRFSHRASGDWPTLTMRSDGFFLEIHSGGTKNLYWETGKLASSSVNWDEKGGTEISDGNHPSMCMNDKGLIAVMLTQGNNGLKYNLGQLVSNQESKPGITWQTKLTDYGSGDHSSVILTDDGCVLEVHSDGSQLYYNVGTLSGDSRSFKWNAASPLPLYVSGGRTSLALRRSDGLVCLVYDTGSSVYYGLGLLDSAHSKIQWITLDNRYVAGQFAAITFAADGKLLETHAGPANDDKLEKKLYWSVGTVVKPSSP